MMRVSVYQLRKQILTHLPDCFLLREFQEAAGLSTDSAWQTCQRWVAAGELVGGRGFYRKSQARLTLPEIFHRAVAGGANGYITGLAILEFRRIWPGVPGVVDFIAWNRPRSSLRFQGRFIRTHRLVRAGASAGLERVGDGGREIALATLERVVADGVAYPNRFLPMSLLAAILRQRRQALRQSRLFDLILATGSESAARRMRILAENAGMKRLPAWLAQQFPGSRMGRIALDPGAPRPQGCPVRHGVFVNLPGF